MSKVYYGVRKVDGVYHPWVAGETFPADLPSFSTALAQARQIAWQTKSIEAIMECYQGDNAEHYQKPRHFEIFDNYRKRIG